jgi:hypothetical protein
MVIGISIASIFAVLLYLFCHHAWAKRQSFPDPYAEQFGRDAE